MNNKSTQDVEEMFSNFFPCTSQVSLSRSISSIIIITIIIANICVCFILIMSLLLLVSVPLYERLSYHSILLSRAVQSSLSLWDTLCSIVLSQYHHVRCAASLGRLWEERYCTLLTWRWVLARQREREKLAYLRLPESQHTHCNY